MNCVQIQKQLELFQQARDQLDEQSQIVQEDVLDTLALKINFAITKLREVVKSRYPNHDFNNTNVKPLLKREKANYAIHKSSLDKAIGEVESWQRLSFNPIWLAIMKLQNQQFDKALDRVKESNQSQGNRLITATMAVRYPLRNISSTHIFLPAGRLESAETAEITFSSVKLVQIDHKWRLLDSVSNISKDTVRELAVRLKKADPSTFGLLKCLGAVHDEKYDNFSIIFGIPDGMSEPETLRAGLIACDTFHSLSDRFRLATQLARAVFSIHVFDMVHKSIRPENIILFRDSESTLGSALLLGFERVRRDEDATRLTGDTDWAKNIYRHPQRQGSRIQDRYIMQHDIYSLGVCLLEIGLWTSFVEYTPNQIPTKSQTYNFCGESPNEYGYPEVVKSHLLSLATNQLPGIMGTKYARIVESCLTCLDLGNEDFGDESELQEDGVAVAVRYIEKVYAQNKEENLSTDGSRFSCS
jgi:hypothetical protein